MMGNFFNRMYFGKGNKGDYTKDDLPDNRWQLFLSMLKLNLGKLTGLNLLFVLFLIPMIFWVSINLQLVTEFYAEGDMMAGMQYIQMTIYGLLPCFVIAGPGLAGVTYITRNMARDQNTWIWADFKDALKANWKQSLAVSALNGVFLILAYIAAVFYGSSAADNAFFVVPQMLVIVMYVFWCAMNLYIWPLMVTYDIGVKGLIKNAALIAIARLPQTVFMGLFTLLMPALLFYIANIYVYIAIFIIYAFLGFAVNSLAINSVTNGIFDKVINLRIKGARVNRGLRVEYDDDDETDSDDDDGDE